ncbi:MAG: glycine cleavage system protein GcvH [Defluviitaleaceae bacterium]|nr:glycine cleavage system protein GcvH [Defluviitaleaceae bacterium]
MKNPENLKYSKDHEWVREEGKKVVVGITDYAQESLGGLVYVNVPEVGDEVVATESFCDVESVKAVSDIYSPVSGKIVAVNELLLDSPESINEDPYGNGWIVEIDEITDTDELMTAQEYEDYCNTLSKE